MHVRQRALALIGVVPQNIHRMNKIFATPSKWLLKGFVFAGCLTMAINVNAVIVGPYTPDAATLHLWHLDETAAPAVDSVPSGGVNLTGLENGAVLGSTSFSTLFKNALNTVDGGQNATAAGTRDALLGASSASPPANVTITLADPTTGAFTFEAVVQVGFDPTLNYGTTANGGNGRNGPFELMTGESGTTANRIFQWRIMPVGSIAGVSQPVVTFENIRAGSAPQATIYAAIPTQGPDAIVSNNWYHVAVTYNGVPNSPGNFKFYWTLMDPSRISANQISIISPTATLSGLNPLSTVSTPFMIGNEGRNRTGNFVGLIDEVRISKVARSSSQMMFTSDNVTIVTEPPSNLLVAAGDTVSISATASGGGTLAYQWQLNGTNLPASVNPTATNATLVLSNIIPSQAGPYQVVVTNSSSSATSTVANIEVGGLFTSLFNSGVNDQGALLPGGTADSHWQLVQSGDSNFPGPNAYVVSSPVPQWLANGPNSQWITPGDGANIAGGTFTYQTTFLLDTLDPTNAQLTGNWISDNQGLNIILNGVNLGITNSTALGSFSSFTITNGFVPGFNTLQCVISNNPGGGNNPSGLRMELRGVALPLPPTPPQLVALPTNVTTQTRQTASFTVAAVGSGPLNYQWYFGAAPLAGQTNRTLVLSGLTAAQAGNYSVTVSNSLGVANATAALTVITPPVVAWLGLNGGDWDTNAVNWLDTDALTDTTFAMLDDVVFDDRGNGANFVNLTQPLTPNSLLVNSTGDYTFSGGGSLTGTFDLTKDGSGALILDTVNNYNGSTIILNGTLQVGNGDASGSLGNGTVSNNAALVFNRTDTFFVPNPISGTGSVATSGSGVAILTGNSSYTGPTIVSAGQLVPRSSTALGTADSPTTVMDGAQLYIDFGVNFANEPLVLGGTGPLGDGALRKGGGNATIFGGPITLSDYSGIQVDSASSLILTNAAAITSTNGNFAVQCLGTGQLTISGAVNLGTGSLTELGAGTVVLSGISNNWTGGTTIMSGSLQIGDGGNDGSIGSGPIEDDSTLTFLSSGNITIASSITGGGALNHNGSGTLTLTGFNSYGSTRITGAGVLVPGNSQALGNGTLTIGSAQNDTCYLLLNGGIWLPNQIVIFPRAFGSLNNPANVVNAAGTNVLNSPSPIVIASGGNLLTFESDSGLLSVSNDITATGVGRDLVLKGAGAGEIRGSINTSGGSVFVWKLDSGTWTLWGNNAPGQPTTVSNGTLIIEGSMDTNPVVVAGGTLAGTGTFAGPVTVNAGGKLAPTLGMGASTPLGLMTINNVLTLQAGSTTALQIDKAAGTSDQVTGLTTVAYGGNLILTNLAGALAQGDAFQLFNAASYSGSFASITPATPGAGLSWDLSTLAVDGTLRVAVASTSRPVITATTVVGNSLVFSGSGGSIGGRYVVLSSTNAAAPLSTWTPVATNNFNGTGNFSVTNTISLTGSRFFILQAQ